MNRCWRVGDSPGRGEGVFATRRIAAGEVVLIEQPLIEFPSVKHAIIKNGVVQSAVVERCHKILQDTDDTILEKVLSLYCPSYLDNEVDGVEGETLRKVLKILLANGLIGDMEDNLPDHEKKVELFYVLSKINHSCCPNVLPCERDGDMVQTRALREIVEGDELFNSYIMFMQTEEERRSDLSRWHFICNCESCSLEGAAQEEDDKARTKVREASEDPDLIEYLEETGSSLALPDILGLLNYQVENLTYAVALKEVSTREKPAILHNCVLLIRFLQENASSSNQHLGEIYRTITSIYGLNGQEEATADLLKDESLRVSRVQGPRAERKTLLALDKIENFCRASLNKTSNVV